MRRTLEINLAGRVAGGYSIQFLKAEVPSEHRVPFALIRFSLEGKPQPYGLRLDMYKKTFLDHTDDKGLEEFLEQAASKIVEVLSEALSENRDV